MTTTTTSWARSMRTSLYGRLFGLAGDATLITRGSPDGFTFSAASSTANICLVTVQAVDNEGASVAGVFLYDLWLSDAATGIGLTAVTASGAVGAGASGADIGVLTTKKATRVQTDATGKYILSITDTAKTAFYVAAQIPGSSRIAVSAVLATANFG